MKERSVQFKWSDVFLEKLTYVLRQSKYFLCFMESEDLSPCWKDLAIGPVREPDVSIHSIPSYFFEIHFNLLKPNDIYICRTAALTSRRYILYIYSTNIHTEYFKHAAKSPFFSLQNAVYFIMLPCLVPVLFACYLQGVLKSKCKIPAPKG